MLSVATCRHHLPSAGSKGAGWRHHATVLTGASHAAWRPVFTTTDRGRWCWRRILGTGVSLDTRLFTVVDSERVFAVGTRVHAYARARARISESRVVGAFGNADRKHLALVPRPSNGGEQRVESRVLISPAETTCVRWWVEESGLCWRPPTRRSRIPRNQVLNVSTPYRSDRSISEETEEARSFVPKVKFHGGVNLTAAPPPQRPSLRPSFDIGQPGEGG